MKKLLNTLLILFEDIYLKLDGRLLACVYGENKGNVLIHWQASGSIPMLGSCIEIARDGFPLRWT